MTKDNFHDMEDKLKDAPFYSLDKDAKERIHEQLMKEAQKLEQQTNKPNKWKKASMWLASAAAVMLFSVITISTLKDNQNTASDSIEIREMANGDQPMEEKAVAEEAAQENVEKHEEPMGHEYLKGTLQIGMNKQEMETIIEEPYTTVVGSKDGTVMWRYDLGVKDSYNPEAFVENGVIYDSVDIDGIASGNIEYQLFAEWEGDSLIGYSIYYQDKSGQVYSYRVFPDGSDKLEKVN